MKNIQNILIALFVALNLLLIASLGNAQDLPGKRHAVKETSSNRRSGPDEGPIVVCKDVGGGVQQCLIKDGAGHTITCQNVGGVCLQ